MLINVMQLTKKKETNKVYSVTPKERFSLVILNVKHASLFLLYISCYEGDGCLYGAAERWLGRQGRGGAKKNALITAGLAAVTKLLPGAMFFVSVLDRNSLNIHLSALGFDMFWSSCGASAVRNLSSCPLVFSLIVSYLLWQGTER